MRTALLVAAILGLGMSSSLACNYQRSVKAEVDKTTVASVIIP